MTAALRLLLATALPLCDAHVRMVYNGMPIRNANGPTSDGGASVNGACGTNDAWGANGFSTVEDGAPVDLVWNYAAGHASNANLMYVSYSCSGTTPNDMAQTANRLLTGVTTGGGCNGDYPCPGPDAVVNGGYTFAAALPKLIDGGGAVTEDTECTISVLDQRDWGGCIDIKLSAAEVIPPPPAPPTPAPMGFYRLRPENALDNSAASFTCCNFSVGLISVPNYLATTDTSFDAYLDGRLENCRSSSGNPTAAGAQNEYDDTYVYEDWKIPFTVVTGTSKFTATMPLMGQTYQFDVEPDGLGGGVVNFFHAPSDAEEQPIACDGFASTLDYVSADPATADKPAIELGVETATAGNVASGGSSSAGVIAGVIIALVLLGGAVVYVKSKGGGSKRGAPPAPPMSAGKDMNMMSVVPPPPGPNLSSSLPPGWQMATDPNTGHPYYVNTATGQSQWTAPSTGGGPPPPPAY